MPHAYSAVLTMQLNTINLGDSIFYASFRNMKDQRAGYHKLYMKV